jgi:hypothetical protein
MKDTGGPAFPFWCDSNGMANFQGMTLRDYFAAKAMQAMIIKPPTEANAAADIVSLAYVAADLMLAERSKK